MKRYLSILTMVLVVVAFGGSLAFAEIVVYDANGQFLGVTDYSEVGGNGIQIWVPKVNAKMMLYNTVIPGEASFDRHINVDETGTLYAPEHSRLLYICEKFYVSRIEYNLEICITDQYWYPCVWRHYDTPICGGGKNYYVEEIDGDILPFTVPIATPLRIEYVPSTHPYYMLPKQPKPWLPPK